MRLITATDIIDKPITLIVGHYGVGKTNLALNLSIDLAARSTQVMLIDLDIVNPYFRSSDYQEDLAAEQVEMITPVFAGTTLDTPTIAPAVAAAFTHTGGPVIFDVGGDDVGATVLGVYRKQLQEAARAATLNFYYVINRSRNLTDTPAQAVGIARQIEAAAGVALTGVINNSHLQDETDLATVARAYPFGEQVAAALDLPLVATTVPTELAPVARLTPEFAEVCGAADLYPVTRLVLPPWE